MKKIVISVSLFSIFFILCYLTFVSAEKVLQPNWQLPKNVRHQDIQYRLVLITQEMDTPFWDKVGKGALEEAVRQGVSLEVWGSYGNNKEDFLKKMEIAIHSKVDGIIIQGLNTEKFNKLSKIKASFYGIPTITVANDVPMSESLRRTYVGSDHYKAGRIIAKQLISDMGIRGNVILMYDDHEENYQEQRLKGILDVLSNYSSIEITQAQTLATREQVVTTTREVLNQVPNADAFISVNANFVGTLIQEIRKRSQVEPYYIYSFDDGPDSESLLLEGKLDGIIGQSPETMGKVSVQLMKEWLNGESGPLDTHGYFTDIQILKATDVNE